MGFNNLIEDLTSLPSLPQAYHRCCQLLEQENTDSKALADVVAVEPAMTISVLKLVNSAFYNIPRSIDRIDHAISILGHQDFKQLILTASVVKAVDSLAHGEVAIDVFWRHSIFTALIARRLALHAYISNCERLFITGLLHDVGQLIYFDLKPQKALEVCALINKYHINVNVAEDKILDFEHQDLGSKLCQHWQLPVWLDQTIAYQYKPSEAGEFELEASIIYLASIMASEYYPGLTDQETEFDELGDSRMIAQAWNKLNINDSIAKEALDEALEELEGVLESITPTVKLPQTN